MKEKTVFLRRIRCAILRSALSLCLLLLVFSRNADGNEDSRGAAALVFDGQQVLGRLDKKPSTPFLRYGPDGALHAVWTEDHDSPSLQATSRAQQHYGMGDRAPSPMRDALLASSTDGGKSWSTPKRINDAVEAVQGEENGPKIAFGPENRAYVVWSIPGANGIRLAPTSAFRWRTAKAASRQGEP